MAIHQSKQQQADRERILPLESWQILENKLDWFALRKGEYVSLEPDEAGIIRSTVMPGLWLAVPALLTGNMLRVLSVLQAGLSSVEHTEFVQRLSEQMI